MRSFASNYFIAHYAFASTVSSKEKLSDMQYWSTCLDNMVEDQIINPMFGCSSELLGIITAISEIEKPEKSCNSNQIRMMEQEETDAEAYEDWFPPTNNELRRQHCRAELEKRLHALTQQVPEANSVQEQEDLRLVSEAKRLGALLYLYARVDNLSPYNATVTRLTEGILNLLPQISLRTSSAVWPLFIAATLGVRPCKEDDRKLVLEVITAMLETRQLAHIRKARSAIIEVWKERDLRLSRDAEEGLGWDIVAGKFGVLSLT